MRSSPLSIEFADGVPQVDLTSFIFRAESEGRSEWQEADLTVVTTNTSPRRVFFLSVET